MAETWIDIGKDLIGKQRLDCQYCFNATGTELAHAIIHKRAFNRKRKHKDIDVRENALPCCPGCQKFSETRKGRLHAWKVLCSWYGDRVRIWYDGLDLKVKEIFE